MIGKLSFNLQRTGKTNLKTWWQGSTTALITRWAWREKRGAWGFKWSRGISWPCSQKLNHRNDYKGEQFNFKSKFPLLKHHSATRETTDSSIQHLRQSQKHRTDRDNSDLNEFPRRVGNRNNEENTAGIVVPHLTAYVLNNSCPRGVIEQRQHKGSCGSLWAQATTSRIWARWCNPWERHSVSKQINAICVHAEWQAKASMANFSDCAHPNAN